MATAAAPLWAYQPKDSDPDQVKSVRYELLSDLFEQVGTANSVTPSFVKAVWFNDGSVTEMVENRLTVDFYKGQVQLPAVIPSSHMPEVPLTADSVRYAAFLKIGDSERVSGEHQVVVVSFWDNERIHNMYFILTLLEALLLTNAISRLVATESLERTRVLYPLISGKVTVSTCEVGRHSANGGCCDSEKVMPFIADCESLGFYENDFSNCPLYDFRFYKESGPRSIDVIMVNKTNGHIQVQQGSSIFIIKKHTDNEATFDVLVKMFKTNVIKSRPHKYFAHPEKCAISTPKPITQMPMSQASRPFDNDDGYGSSWQNMNARHLNPEWLNDLYYGNHIPSDEGMLAFWCTFEYDLKECIDSGIVPYTSPESGGLDPNSHDHLQRSLEDIKDQLLTNSWSLALSRLRACLAVFRKTLLSPVEYLEEVEFMKRIYFLSGRNLEFS